MGEKKAEAKTIKEISADNMQKLRAFDECIDEWVPGRAGDVYLVFSSQQGRTNAKKLLETCGLWDDGCRLAGYTGVTQDKYSLQISEFARNVIRPPDKFYPLSCWTRKDALKGTWQEGSGQELAFLTRTKDSFVSGDDVSRASLLECIEAMRLPEELATRMEASLYKEPQGRYVFEGIKADAVLAVVKAPNMSASSSIGFFIEQKRQKAVAEAQQQPQQQPPSAPGRVVVGESDSEPPLEFAPDPGEEQNEFLQPG